MNKIPRNTEEIPISAHIYEGYLYIKNNRNNKWLWCLFRFDGSSLACLSSKKIKLPPRTLLDSYSTVDHRHFSFPTISTLNNSHTSPLLATPKDKSARLVNSSEHSKTLKGSSIIASYYQLPKWTVDIINISSISILKSKTTPHKSFKHPFSRDSTKCFCIRTYNGDCYVMKAHTQDELERWIFVLSKMWNITQAARKLHYPSISPVSPQSNALPSSCQPYHVATPDIVTNNSNEIISTVPIAQKYFTMESTPGLQTNLAPSLSNEKVVWIEEWIKSLEELGDNNDLNHTESPENGSVLETPITSSVLLSMNKPELKRKRSIRHRKRKSYTDRVTTSQDMKLSAMQSYQPRQEPTKNDLAGINFFQDAHSIYTDNEYLNKEYKHHSLTYHDLTREQRVSIVQSKPEQTIKVPPEDVPLHSIQGEYVAFINDDYSPLENLQNEVSCIYNNVNDTSKDKSLLLQPFKVQNDENICLADVRKSLQNMIISNKR